MPSVITLDKRETPHGLTLQRFRDGICVDAVTFGYGGKLTFYHYLTIVNGGPSSGGCSALNGNYCGRMSLDKGTTSLIRDQKSEEERYREMERILQDFDPPYIHWKFDK